MKFNGGVILTLATYQVNGTTCEEGATTATLIQVNPSNMHMSLTVVATVNISELFNFMIEFNNFGFTMNCSYFVVMAALSLYRWTYTVSNNYERISS